MEVDTKPFSKALSIKYPGEENVEFFFHKIEFEDKMIINIQIDGSMDMTFDIADTFRTSNPSFLRSSNEDGEHEIEPRILLGNHKNIKLQIVASQIGKLALNSSRPKSIILSIGSRWFGDGESVEKQDFDKLLFILDNVKDLLQ